jgi:hypothetical protein
MPWDPNIARSQAVRQQNQQLVQQQLQHTHRANQQRFDKQMSDMMARSRIDRRATRPEQAADGDFPGDEDFADTTRRGGMRTVAVMLAALALAVLGGFLILHSTATDVSSPPPFVHGPRGVHGQVRPETTWNLRAGPSSDAAIVGQAAAGTQVTVECVRGGWARLSAPVPGVFIFAEGLQFDAAPDPC